LYNNNVSPKKDEKTVVLPKIEEREDPSIVLNKVESKYLLPRNNSLDPKVLA